MLAGFFRAEPRDTRRESKIQGAPETILYFGGVDSFQAQCGLGELLFGAPYRVAGADSLEGGISPFNRM